MSKTKGKLFILAVDKEKQERESKEMLDEIMKSVIPDWNPNLRLQDLDCFKEAVRENRELKINKILKPKKKTK